MNCECLKNIASNTSQIYNQNGKDACVQVSVNGQVSITPWVKGRNNKHQDIIRRSKHTMTEGIALNFCPICGIPTEGYHFAEVWPD